MSVEQARLAKSISDFFLRSGLTPQDQIDCFALVEQLFPGKSVSPVASQGYCSLTVVVGDDLVVQFRPDRYRLDLRITTAAREIYGSFAPSTRYLATLPISGLLVYSIDRISGISLKEFRNDSARSGNSFELRATLCRDFARFISKGWHQSNADQIELGIVGRSITSRLKSLSTELPVRFQPPARRIIGTLHLIEQLPWVLTHGDIAAGNIMVEPSSGRLLGLVDWAEAEPLPFGTCLYGLEEFLGEMTTTGFQYYRDASDLRKVFWAEMMIEMPELDQPQVLQAVNLTRDLGVLLWHGIAFDDGRIDRVVQEGRDIDEIYRLDAFLDLQNTQLVDRTAKIIRPTIYQ